MLKLNNTIHLILQPQSGIGKKYIASLLKQYLSQKFNIKSFFIKNKNIELWDEIFSDLFEQNKSTFLIAVSSSCFTSFKNYLKDIKFFKSIKVSNNSLFRHYIFTPGRNGENFKKTLNFIINNLKKSDIKNYVWENNNIGTTTENYTKGKYLRFQNLPELKQLKRPAFKTIYLPEESFCFQKDLASHICSRQTFHQAIYKSQNNLIFRQRIYQFKKRLFKELLNANI